MVKKKKAEWVYTSKRKESMRSAQTRHVTYVRLGKKAYARGER